MYPYTVRGFTATCEILKNFRSRITAYIQKRQGYRFVHTCLQMGKFEYLMQIFALNKLLEV